MDNIIIEKLIEEKKYWQAQAGLVSLKKTATDASIRAAVSQRSSEVFDLIAAQATDSVTPASIKFGTSGWRAVIGEDYTVLNVKRVTQAVVNMLKTPEFLAEIGVTSFADVQSRGGLIGFDSRFMGEVFARAVASVLTGNGIKVFYSGMSTTPELSAAVVELKAAFSINLTPSHNPFEYAGYKFNPADGGPAGQNLTTLIENFCMEIMVGAELKTAAPVWETVDSIALYQRFISKNNKVIDLEALVRQINASDIFLAFDNVHGATRDRLERLLSGVAADKMQFLRTEEDYLFGGIKPEPSQANMQQVTELLITKLSRFKVGAIMDPDGDRVRLTDGVTDVEMNFFGAMTLYYFAKVKGMTGCLAKSVATSNFANAVADKLGVQVKETAVGFKEFRPYLAGTAKQKAIVAFEESDGITMQDHTLEKDALIGALLAVKMVLDMQKNLSGILQEVQAFAGVYFPGRGGMDVDRALAGAPLLEKLKDLSRYKIGDLINVGETPKTIKSILTLDGYKFVFEDNSWLLIRPSGTEPKVRFYVEGRSETSRLQLLDSAKTLLAACL